MWPQGCFRWWVLNDACWRQTLTPGVLPLPVHRHGHLHLLCSHALGGGGSAWDPVQQHTGRLVVGCGKCNPPLYSSSQFYTLLIIFFHPGSCCAMEHPEAYDWNFGLFSRRQKRGSASSCIWILVYSMTWLKDWQLKKCSKKQSIENK